MKLATNEQMRNIDKRAIQEYKIPGIVLMENAAIKVFQAAQKFLNPISHKKVAVFAGKGNNGGDGFAVARHLYNAGADVKIYLAAPLNVIKGDAQVNLNIILKMGLEVKEIIDFEQLTPADRLFIEKADLIIDALLGTGIKGKVRSPFKEIIDYINNLNTYVISVDIPSGINGDTGEVCGNCVKADKTITFALPKIGTAVHPGVEFTGEVEVADISIPEEVIRLEKIKSELVTLEWVRQRFPKRVPYSHKGDYGRVVIIAGSPGLTGAAYLCSQGALRAGAGLVTLGVPKSLNPVLEAKLTEVMTRPLPETNNKVLGREGLGDIMEMVKKSDVAALGPGLSTYQEVKELVRQLVVRVQKPLVIDADGLNCLADNPEVLSQRTCPTVITPHPGELARVMKTDAKTIQQDRIGWAKKAASELKCITVLKGARTVTAHQDGRVFINTTGNPGMASGGSGDILTGVIAAFIGRGIPPIDAAVLGVFLHGMAGDAAAEKHGEDWITAGDVCKYLDKAFLAVYN